MDKKKIEQYQALAAALVVALALPLVSRGQGQSPNCPAEPRPPDRIGSFSLLNASPVEPPARGTRYRYADDDSLRLDVFVYPLPDGSTMSGPEDARAAVREQIAVFKESLPYGLNHGWYDRYEIATEQTEDVATSDGVIPGARVSYVFIKDGDVFESLYSIHAVACSFVKVRATAAPASWQADPFGEFTRELLAALASAVRR